MAFQMYEEKGEAIQLPHPTLSLRFSLIIEAAICTTWELMLGFGRPGFNLQDATEDVVTHELYERLYDEVFDKGLVAGFDREIFSSVHREPKIRNFDGKNLDKMPDMFIVFVDHPIGVMNTQYGLFIECKPVDKTHPAGSAYCDEGLIRFVRGDYAWTMKDAMMIGYARKGYCLLSKLSTALLKRRDTLHAKTAPKKCSKSRPVKHAEQIVSTEHDRVFIYPNSKQKPGRIVIRHLWLSR